MFIEITQLLDKMGFYVCVKCNKYGSVFYGQMSESEGYYNDS